MVGTGICVTKTQTKVNFTNITFAFNKSVYWPQLIWYLYPHPSTFCPLYHLLSSDALNCNVVQWLCDWFSDLAAYTVVLTAPRNFCVNLVLVPSVTPSCPGRILHYVIRALCVCVCVCVCVWRVEVCIEYSFPFHCIWYFVFIVIRAVCYNAWL
jgi:hypothetical protein